MGKGITPLTTFLAIPGAQVEDRQTPNTESPRPWGLVPLGQFLGPALVSLFIRAKTQEWGGKREHGPFAPNPE